MRPGYRLVDGPPTVADYLLLRDRAGLSPKRQDQAEAALGGSWAAVHVVHEADGSTAGMGRVLGDGGWYFHVVDMPYSRSINGGVSATPFSPAYSAESVEQHPRARS